MLYDISKLSPSIQYEIESNNTIKRLFNTMPETLLTVGNDAKTVKGEKKGFYTGILYLAPFNTSGVNVCPMAEKAQCANACLFTAGRGAMYSVFYARLRKTLFMQQYKTEFYNILSKDINGLIKKSNKDNMGLAIRLNGTSDIRFENSGIMQDFKDVQFYDYTKIANRKNIPSNYDLTFSYSGVNTFAPYVNEAIANDMRLAVVFRDRQTVETMLAQGIKFLGLDIVDGDETDLRFLEPQGVITALYAKGRAKMDGTGFVVDIPEQFKLAA